MEFSRHTWQLSMLLNGKSLPTVYSYSDWLVFRRKVHIRFGEMHSWILYWNNWTLSKDPKQEQTRADLWQNIMVLRTGLYSNKSVQTFSRKHSRISLWHTFCSTSSIVSNRSV
jgi:hypothetical protein